MTMALTGPLHWWWTPTADGRHLTHRATTQYGDLLRTACGMQTTAISPGSGRRDVCRECRDRMAAS